MNILILDQSTNKTGWCISDDKKRLKEYGVIDLSSLPKSTDQDQANKRHQLINQIQKIVLKYKVQLITTEGIYFHSNAATYKKLAQIQGCIQDMSCNQNIVCFSWMNAGEWRKYIGIKSKKREDYKIETKRYAIAKYELPDNLIEDIYDAVAMCDAYFIMIEEKK